MQEVRMVALQECRDAVQHIAASNGWSEDRTPNNETHPMNNHKHRQQPAQPVPSQSTSRNDQYPRSTSTVVNRHEQKESFSTPRRETSQPKPWKRESPQAKTVKFKNGNPCIVSGTLNHHINVHALLDTGSDVNLINKNVYEKLLKAGL